MAVTWQDRSLRRVDGRQGRRLLKLRIDLLQSRFPSNEARCRLVRVFPPVPTASYRAGRMLGIEQPVSYSQLAVISVTDAVRRLYGSW